MTNLLSLPVELIASIFDSVGRHPTSAHSSPHTLADRGLTLRALCLTSRLCRDLAQPIIYFDLYITSEEQAERLLASDAFSRQSTVSSLELRNLANDDLVAMSTLITETGRKRLKRLKLYRLELDASSFEQVGQELQSLELIRMTTLHGESFTGTVPFQLFHIKVGWGSLPQSFLGVLVSSPRLRTLDIAGSAGSPSLSALFSLPEFPSMAARIKSLVVFELPHTHLTGLATFTSVSHLYLECTLLHQVVDFVETLPAESQTVTHLTVVLKKSDFASLNAREKWKNMMRLKQLEKLKLVTWIRINGILYPELLDDLRATREVRMEWSDSNDWLPQG
ncbi:hypothetical protein P7C70_g6288, partial [Phenoliferia sp. Uapishka_3]